ncbi:Kinesin-like protein kif21b, partial [Irineochytrium annulatum]
MSTNVRVAIRIRPLNAKEILANGAECIRMVPDLPQIVVGTEASTGTGVGHNFATRSFTFDEVFGADSIQSEVYQVCVAPLVERFLEGFNSTALAYGQTGSGKTWSMGTGLDSASLPPDQIGIVPRSIRELFRQLTERKGRCTAGFKFTVLVSFLELYNEDLVDLLNPRPKSASGGGGPTIREDSQGNIVWGGVREEEVSSPDELLSIILKQQRWTPISKQPDGPVSSSPELAGQTVYEISVEADPTTHPDGAWRHLTSKFHFVDLAGSERLKRTNAEGDRKKEGISINQGLLALGNVISALGDETRRGSHVPYRDSKLTRMLQDSLGGNSQTLMLACVSPSDSSYGETVNTLNYANRARNIRNRVVVNQEFFGGSGGGSEKEREIRALRALVADLKDEVAALKGGGAQGGRLQHQQQAAVDAAVVSRERQINLHMQGERDLSMKLEAARGELRVSEFENDRLSFTCARLAERGREMAEELASTVTERDAALVELARWRSGRRSFGDKQAEEGLPDTRPPAAPVEPNVIADYQNTISDLRLRLSEAEDRLAWYHEMVSELENGKRRTRPPKFVSSDSTLQRPNNQKDRVLSSVGEEPEVAHERRLLKALKNDPELGKVLSSQEENDADLPGASAPSDYDSLKLYGLPRITTASWKPSNLGDGAEDDDSPQQEDEYDDEDYGDEDEDGMDISLPKRPVSRGNKMAGGERSADMYMFVHRLQSEIADHEGIVDRLAKREREYEAMRGAYDAKLSVLKSQVDAISRERDEAIKRMRGDTSATGFGKGGGDKAKTAAIAARFDDEKKRLEAQISELRKKLKEGDRMQSSARGRNVNLNKQLTATIDALKMEKAKMLKELKKEAERSRNIKLEKEREIARLKRKEKAAAEMAKKLERSNQLQRLMIKRRSEEMVNSHSKLKSVMSLLKRNNAGSGLSGAARIEKPSGVVSPIKRPRSRPFRTATPVAMGQDILKKALRVDVETGAMTSFASTRPPSPPPEVRAKFKRQMIEKEILTVVTYRLSDLELSKLRGGLDRLVGEQLELVAERERCVVADAERTGVYAPHLAQYMDERLGVLDLEIAMANSRIRKVEEEMKIVQSKAMLENMTKGSGNGEASPPSFVPSMTDGELGWENALNLLRSLDAIELEHVATMFLEDIVSLRVSMRNKDSMAADREKVVTDLRTALETMRGAALQTAIEYRKELEEVRMEANRRIAEASGGSNTPPSNTTPPTPRIQKMFDAAYGQGVVVIAPSALREHGMPSKSEVASVPKMEADGWMTSAEDEMDPKRRGIAPAAAAALESMKQAASSRGINFHGSLADGKSSDDPSFTYTSSMARPMRNFSPSKPAVSTLNRMNVSTPPRGKIAAEAAAAGAAAAALARVSESDPHAYDNPAEYSSRFGFNARATSPTSRAYGTGFEPDAEVANGESPPRGRPRNPSYEIPTYVGNGNGAAQVKRKGSIPALGHSSSSLLSTEDVDDDGYELGIGGISAITNWTRSQGPKLGLTRFGGGLGKENIVSAAYMDGSGLPPRGPLSKKRSASPIGGQGMIPGVMG